MHPYTSLISGNLRGAFVAMNDDNVIGVDGGLPWHYSADLKRFKRQTMGSTIIMGRITWESIGSKALPGRRNIVISRNPVDGCEGYNSIDLALSQCADDDVWIIGGGQVYQAAMDKLNLLDVTYVPDKVAAEGSIKFPQIDPRMWKQASSTRLEDDPRLVNRVYIRR